MEPPEDPIADLDDESKQNLANVISSCLSTRERQVYFLHHGIVGSRMHHKKIAKILDLTEAEVDEIYYHAEIAIRALRDQLTDLLGDEPKGPTRQLHVWAVH